MSLDIGDIGMSAGGYNYWPVCSTGVGDRKIFETICGKSKEK